MPKNILRILETKANREEKDGESNVWITSSGLAPKSALLT
jgi:hypothetical protein